VGAVTLRPPDLGGHDRDVQRAVAGDREALRRLWEVHRRWVAGVILAHMPASAELEDLLQEVAASLVGNIHRLTAPEHFVGWLRTVAINAARLQGRKASTGLGRYRLIRGDDGHDAMDGAAATRPGADAHEAQVSEEARRLLTLAQSLPEGYREPLLLRCVQGLSYQQIGEILGLPATTVETRIARGRRMLRQRADAPDPRRAGAGTPG
jgi:RNA polymerase sigma-70 factor (ECF subfamily)